MNALIKFFTIVIYLLINGIALLMSGSHCGWPASAGIIFGSLEVIASSIVFGFWIYISVTNDSLGFDVPHFQLTKEN